jgi:esterase
MSGEPTIYFRQWGEGVPVIVLHGLFGSMENLGMITRLLKDKFCIYGLDLPDHGRSKHVDKISIEGMAEIIVSWMQEQGISKSHFLGHSLGGKVCMEVALRYPQMVDKLVVADIAPVKYVPRHDDVFAGLNAIDLNTIRSRKDAASVLAQYVKEPSTRSFLLKNLEKNDDGWQWRMNLDGLSRNYQSLIIGNSTEFPPFNRPVLFIKGEKSDYILPEYKETILQLFPQSQLKVIHNTEHWLHAEKPEIFAGIVERFLKY